MEPLTLAAVIITIVNIAFAAHVVFSKGIVIQHEHKYIYPETPAPTMVPVPQQPEDEAVKAIRDAAASLQAIFLDDNQIIKEDKRNG